MIRPIFITQFNSDKIIKSFDHYIEGNWVYLFDTERGKSFGKRKTIKHEIQFHKSEHEARDYINRNRSVKYKPITDQIGIFYQNVKNKEDIIEVFSNHQDNVRFNTIITVTYFRGNISGQMTIDYLNKYYKKI